MKPETKTAAVNAYPPLKELQNEIINELLQAYMELKNAKARYEDARYALECHLLDDPIKKEPTPQELTEIPL